MTATNVLNSITSLITIPLLSALIAQAAAVHSQKQFLQGDLQLKHLVTLSDRGWTNPLSMGESIRWRGRGSKTSRNLLLFAAIVLILGAIQQPLYQILAPTESILVPTCKDTEYMRYALKNYDVKQCKKGTPARAVGWDVEPSTMRDTSYEDMVQKLMRDLADVSVSDVVPNLWADEPNALADKKTVGDANNSTNRHFVATLEQATTTGVLREHIIRLNSSVSCNRLDRSQYPSTCSGNRPFTREFVHDNNRTRICVPGELGPSPWTLSRNRQELSEDLYIDILEELVFSPGLVDERNWTTDVTLHCTANTTRGYFELGNYRNNNTWGPLLEHWPSPSQIETEFNDYMSDSSTEYPSESDDHGQTVLGETTIWPSSWHNQGPLTMAAVSLFGNKTFFDLGTLVWNDTLSDTELSILSYNKLCSLVPFSRLIPLRVGEGSDLGPGRDEKFPPCSVSSIDDSDDRTLKDHLSAWLHGFNKTDQATTAIYASVYLANEASLSLDKWQQDRYNPGRALRAEGGRTIYTALGITVNKPKLSIAAMSVLSALLLLELASLGILAYLIYQAPSESRSLDVLTFVKYKDCIDDRIKR